MRIKEQGTGAQPRLGLGAVVVCAAVVTGLLAPAPGAPTPAPAFTVVDAQFHQRAPEDAGEARICLQNTGANSLSLAQLQARVLERKTADSTTTECRYVYAKLAPPLVPPGQYGAVVMKLQEHPQDSGSLTCDLSAADRTAFATVPLVEPALWISGVGFSEDLRRVFVYVENLGGEPAEAQLLGIGPFDLTGRTRALHFPVPPGDKGCLIGELPSPVTVGQFVYVVLATDVGGRQSRIHTVVRVLPALALTAENATNDASLGLDAESPFLQTMVCPAHAHGSHEAAAAEFLADYTRRFADDPRRSVQMAICRNDVPRAWFRFGPLPDVAAVNTSLYLRAGYDKNPQPRLSPCFQMGSLAKRATEPGGFLAIIPTGADTENESFIHAKRTPQEWKYLVYSAMASGARGVVYRGMPVDNPLHRDAFVQLNRELQHLRPLWSLAEPVEWASAKEEGYAAQCLWCGDQALLVLVFDLRYFSRQRDGKLYTPPFGGTVVPVRLHVKTPAGMEVKEVRTPFTALAREDWDAYGGTLDLAATMMNSAQVYILSLQPSIRRPEGGPQP